MTDKKFTDEEIIKALKCLCGGGDSCFECAYHKMYRFGECRKQVAKDALDLIRRQKTEIERLQKDQDDIDNFARDICKERLLKGKAIANFDDLQEYIRKEKSKAVKEFAEALRKHYDNPVWYLGGSNGFFDNLDSFVKEMVGEKE